MSSRRATLKKIGATGGGGFDVDYQAILDQADVNGYTKPSAAYQTLQNQLVVDLKLEGVWSLLDEFYLFVDDSPESFNYMNWKSPADELVKLKAGTYKSVVNRRAEFPLVTDTIGFMRSPYLYNDVVNRNISETSAMWSWYSGSTAGLNSGSKLLFLNDASDVTYFWARILSGSTRLYFHRLGYRNISGTFGAMSSYRHRMYQRVGGSNMELYENGSSIAVAAQAHIGSLPATYPQIFRSGSTAGAQSCYFKVIALGQPFSATQAANYFTLINDYIIAAEAL